MLTQFRSSRNGWIADLKWTARAGFEVRLQKSQGSDFCLRPRGLTLHCYHPAPRPRILEPLAPSMVRVQQDILVQHFYHPWRWYGDGLWPGVYHILKSIILWFRFIYRAMKQHFMGFQHVFQLWILDMSGIFTGPWAMMGSLVLWSFAKQWVILTAGCSKTAGYLRIVHVTQC